MYTLNCAPARRALVSRQRSRSGGRCSLSQHWLVRVLVHPCSIKGSSLVLISCRRRSSRSSRMRCRAKARLARPSRQVLAYRRCCLRRARSAGTDQHGSICRVCTCSIRTSISISKLIQTLVLQCANRCWSRTSSSSSTSSTISSCSSSSSSRSIRRNRAPSAKERMHPALHRHQLVVLALLLILQL